MPEFVDANAPQFVDAASPQFVDAAGPSAEGKQPKPSMQVPEAVKAIGNLSLPNLATYLRAYRQATGQQEPFAVDKNW